jgi:hypothetical protein
MVTAAVAQLLLNSELPDASTLYDVLNCNANSINIL